MAAKRQAGGGQVLVHVPTLIGGVRAFSSMHYAVRKRTESVDHARETELASNGSEPTVRVMRAL